MVGCILICSCEIGLEKGFSATQRVMVMSVTPIKAKRHETRQEEEDDDADKGCFGLSLLLIIGFRRVVVSLPLICRERRLFSGLGSQEKLSLPMATGSFVMALCLTVLVFVCVTLLLLVVLLLLLLLITFRLRFSPPPTFRVGWISPLCEVSS